MQLTILFDPPYYVGVLEMERDNLLYVARHIFGAEPSDQEVYEFVQRDLLTLQTTMTVGLPIEARTTQPVNPKRVQREVRHQLAQVGISTKAQEAMRLQLEQNKHKRIVHSREERAAHKEYKRAVARDKAKARQRGR